ncbi:MAG: hypothetical protein GXP18_08290 [Gammaproteobacteria bacterium]|nr:hypothetical protein [Gammaproteobacteria bacterium]
MMEQKSKKPKTLEEIKKEKGKTCWAYLVAEEQNANKISGCKKFAVDFGVSA